MSQTPSSAQFLFLFRHRDDAPDRTPAEMEQVMNKVMAWMRALKSRGELVDTRPLADEGRVLRGPGGTTITDGPFVEAKEVVGGFVIVNARDLDAAAAIARGCPMLERISVEVRELNSLPPI